MEAHCIYAWEDVTLVEFLSFSKQKYISKTDLEQAINELIEENSISEKMKEELLKCQNSTRGILSMLKNH